jgi:hypothetical protein
MNQRGTCVTAFEKAVVQLKLICKTDEYIPFLAVKNLKVQEKEAIMREEIW